MLGPPPPTDRLLGWTVTVFLGLIAASVRFAGLGSPTDGGTPVFDEKHYVPQAWQMLRNGGVEDNPGFELVVHPPLGKQLIAIGEAAFGYDAVGWRFAAALASVLCVVLIVRVGRRLTRSTLLGGIAGVLLICDGLSHVQGRMGMLDVFSALFVVAGFTTLVCDRDDVRARMAKVVAEGRVGDSPLGPRMGVRWWRLATGVLLGLGCAVKWSGIYWVMAFAVLSVIWDLTARRKAGVAQPWKGTLVRDVAPLGVGARARAGGRVLRRLVARGSPAKPPPTATPPPTPCPRCSTSRARCWRSTRASPRSRRACTRGSRSRGRGRWGCGRCSTTTRATASPAAATPSASAPSCSSARPRCGGPRRSCSAFSLWRVVTRFDWRYGAVLVGYAAGIVPWFMDIDRQMFFFYMTPVVPFLVLATVLIMGEVLGRADIGKERRQTGLLVVGLWVGLVVANFVWLWPILTAEPITQQMWDAQLWLPSWRA